jgi:glycosyltransferase involved in cell wall biosynthesis
VSEKKVLIITYYWPPSGGSGVQRWLKFVKYLPQYGVTPYVFTPENPAFSIQDTSLLKDVPNEAEVIHFPIWEPYDAFFKISKLFGSNKSAKPTDLVSAKQKSLFQKISTWLRGNLFIPDPRVFWVRPSVRFLHDFLIDNKIRTIITTGPPHSMHLIGYQLKKKNPALKWIADFRDPWSEWGLLDSLSVSSPIRAVHKKLELKVLRKADEIITITPFYVKRFKELSGRHVQLLTNGFDEDDFQSIQLSTSDKFIIRHVGIINEKCDPRPFMNAVLAFMETNADFKAKVQIEFIGEVHEQFRHYVNTVSALASVAKFTGNIPHKSLMSLYGTSSLLILILHGYKDAAGYMPGKLFEYLATGLPVMGVGPTNGDAANLLTESKAGEMFEALDHAGMMNALSNHFSKWNDVITQDSNNKNSALKYSRREITRTLSTLI